MLMRTDPFRDLDRLASEMLGAPFRSTSMPLDAYRHGDVFVVELEVPGVDPEAIDLTVEKNVLTVRAERSRPDVEDAQHLISERSHGSFTRQLFLGDTLDPDNLTADYRNGVLTIRVPLAERARPRRIEIGTGERAAIEAPSSEAATADAA